MGMSEISSVPLAVMDFFKQFKSVKARYESVYEIIQVIFCLLFLPIRGVYWPCTIAPGDADSRTHTSTHTRTHTHVSASRTICD